MKRAAAAKSYGSIDSARSKNPKAVAAGSPTQQSRICVLGAGSIGLPVGAMNYINIGGITQRYSQNTLKYIIHDFTPLHAYFEHYRKNIRPLRIFIQYQTRPDA
jgi:hypothetical protein